MDMTTKLRDVPPILLVDLSHDKLVFSEELVFPCEGVIATLRLRGIIYGGQGYFTCRFIDKTGDIWFHDGIVTGGNCLPEINIQRVGDRIWKNPTTYRDVCSQHSPDSKGQPPLKFATQGRKSELTAIEKWSSLHEST
jgi:hypothetical protein